MWPGIPDTYQNLPESDSGSFRYTRSRDYQTPTRHALLGSGIGVEKRTFSYGTRLRRHTGRWQRRRYVLNFTGSGILIFSKLSGKSLFTTVILYSSASTYLLEQCLFSSNVVTRTFALCCHDHRYNIKYSLDTWLANQRAVKGVVTIFCRLEIRKIAEC